MFEEIVAEMSEPEVREIVTLAADSYAFLLTPGKNYSMADFAKEVEKLSDMKQDRVDVVCQVLTKRANGTISRSRDKGTKLEYQVIKK